MFITYHRNGSLERLVGRKKLYLIYTMSALFFLGLFVEFSGMGLNVLTQKLNGGLMPAISSKEGFVIIPGHRHVVLFDPTSVKVSYLTDMHFYDFRELAILPEFLKYPIEFAFFGSEKLEHEVGFASIGDFMIWGGRFARCMATILVIVLLPYVLGKALKSRQGAT